MPETAYLGGAAWPWAWACRWASCRAFGVEGLVRDVFLVESALPVVSQVTVMAGAYGADEEYAATGACLSILGCFVTLPILMLILG